MITHAQQPLVSWEEIQDIELVVVRRMQEFATGLHRSVFYGSGFDLVGLRDWQPGDRPSAVDWAQSSLTNFSPLMTREFEQESTASVIIVADTSLSTQCGVNGTPIAKVVARTVATLAIAAAFFQDLVGLVTMDAKPGGRTARNFRMSIADHGPADRGQRHHHRPRVRWDEMRQGPERHAISPPVLTARSGLGSRSSKRRPHEAPVRHRRIYPLALSDEERIACSHRTHACRERP